MRTELKISNLQRLLDQSQDLKDRGKEDAGFVAWHHSTVLALAKIFGKDSLQYSAFVEKNFAQPYFARNMHEVDRAIKTKELYNRDLQVVQASLQGYLNDLAQEDSEPKNTPSATVEPTMSKGAEKVFISHSSADKEIVGELIEMLKLIGLRPHQIFCTSFPEYGIPLGVNYLDWLRAEITDNALVLFVLSHSFYASPICLSEMGATWALAKHHVPLLVPPFTYDDVKGVFPQSQGMLINERAKYNGLASLIEKQFGLPSPRATDWEMSRNKILDRIDAHAQAAIEAEKAVAKAQEEEAQRPWLEIQALLAALSKKIG